MFIFKSCGLQIISAKNKSNYEKRTYGFLSSFKLFIYLFIINVCTDGFAHSYSFWWYVASTFVYFGRTESKIKEMNGTQDASFCS